MEKEGDMSAVQELCCLYGINPKQLSKEENILLEANLFVRICDELKEIFKNHNRDFYRLFKFTKEMENEMLEANFIRCIVNDILSTEEYSLDGIACYSNSPEEIIHEIAAGLNSNPSLLLARKIIELHRSIRPDLYRSIMFKIVSTTN